MCLQARDEGVLFSGDTLFTGGWGRVDLPGGDAVAMAASIARLSGLEDGVRVHPGHGASTTIGRERAWMELVRDGGDCSPDERAPYDRLRSRRYADDLGVNTVNPRPSYRPRAPFGLSASTPSMPSVIPRSRSRRSDIGRDRPRQPTPAPRTPDADVLEPAALDAGRRVLLRPDPVLDDTRDLVAVPGDDPQRRVELLECVGAGRSRDSSLLARTPVVAEGLDLGVEHDPMLVVGRGRVRARPAGERRDRLGQVATHEEEPAKGLEPFAREQRLVPELLGLGERTELPGQVVGIDHGPLRGAPDVLAEQRPTQPAPTDGRMDEARAVIDGHAVTDHPFHLGETDDAVLHLDDHDVKDRVEARVVLEVVTDVRRVGLHGRPSCRLAAMMSSLRALCSAVSRRPRRARRPGRRGVGSSSTMMSVSVVMVSPGGRSVLRGTT